MYIIEANYIELNGELFVRKDIDSNGGLLSYDYMRIDKIERKDESHINLIITAFGDKENWESDKDLITEKKIELMKENGNWKIDKADNLTISFIESLELFRENEDVL